MRDALEITGLSKRFVAGCGSCLASAQALVDVDLAVAAGESVAIAGGSGAGKTTLILCAAGLMTPDAGVVRWFGDRGRAAALERARLHYHRSSLADACIADGCVVHLVDVGDAEASRIGAWVAARRDAGDAVVIAVRDASLGRALAGRVVTLGRGRIVSPSAPSARVAEPVFVDRPLGHV